MSLLYFPNSLMILNLRSHQNDRSENLSPNTLIPIFVSSESLMDCNKEASIPCLSMECQWHCQKSTYATQESAYCSARWVGIPIFSITSMISVFCTWWEMRSPRGQTVGSLMELRSLASPEISSARSQMFCPFFRISRSMYWRILFQSEFSDHRRKGLTCRFWKFFLK